MAGLAVLLASLSLSLCLPDLSPHQVSLLWVSSSGGWRSSWGEEASCLQNMTQEYMHMLVLQVCETGKRNEHLWNTPLAFGGALLAVFLGDADLLLLVLLLLPSVI